MSRDGTYATGYTYSATGNIDFMPGVGVYTYTASASSCMGGANGPKPHAVSEAGSYDFTYDCNGNMVTRVISGTTYTLVYDAEGRMMGFSGAGVTASFGYDGDGQRITGTVGAVTTAYIGGHYEWLGSTTASKKYYYAGALRVAVRTGSGNPNYLLGDHLGSTSLTASSTGGFVSEVRYLPFGRDRYTSGTTPTTYRFNGQRQESGLGPDAWLGGLYYFNARWVDPLVGRFASADTIVPGLAPSRGGSTVGYDERNALASLTVDFHESQFLAGLHAEHTFMARHGYWFQLDHEERQQAKYPWGPVNPQSLNRYSYGLNNPIRYTDPSGHFVWTPLAVLAAAVAIAIVAIVAVNELYYAPNAPYAGLFPVESAANSILSGLETTTNRITILSQLAVQLGSNLLRTEIRETANGDKVRVRRLTDSEVSRRGLHLPK